jgi:RND superfamily putative drug exporter
MELRRMLEATGRACAAHPLRVAGGWLAVLAVVVALSATVGGTLRDAMTVPGTSSDRAYARLLAGFPAEAGAEAHVVARWPDSSPDRAALARAIGDVRGLAGVRTVDERDSADGRTTLLEVRYDAEVADVPLRAATDALTRASAPLADAGARVGVGGEVPEAIQGPNGLAETVGVGIALVILLVAFGSALAAGLPLLIAGVAVGAGLGLITLLARGLDVNTVSPTLGSMIGLGVGIDYALFVVARHREGMLNGLGSIEAAARATASAGRSVVFAGGTVLVAITGLALSGVPSFGSMGLAAGLVVLCAVAASITLLPGMLGALGHRVFGRRARRTAAGSTRAGFRSRWAERMGRAVVRRPAIWLTAAVVAMLTLAAPALGMRLGQNDAGSERASSPTRQAYDLVATGFGPGANGPLTIVVDRHRVDDPTLTRLMADVAATPGVAGVSPPAVSPDGDTVAFQATPSSGPQDDRTYALVHRLHDGLPAGVDVTGPTATIVDMTGTLSAHLWQVIGAVLAATFVLLVFVFRSLVLPVKAVLTNLLSVGAAYGVMTLAFQTQVGARLVGLDAPVPIAAWAPVVLFAILFGLSMDYEVFMLSRVRERYDQTGSVPASVVSGLADTARIVTSAAGIMIAVALGFALDPSVQVKIIGVGMAAAIFVDVTVARLMLVPAAMALLGERNWYLPRWLDGRSPAPASARTHPAEHDRDDTLAGLRA